MKYLLLILFCVQIQARQPLQEFIGTCDFYPQLIKKLKCSEDSYLKEFGEFYCRKFDESISKFSPLAQKKLKQIKSCLQTTLLADPKLSCQNVRSIALDSHITCYSKAKFCDMALADKTLLGSIVSAAALDSDYRRTMGKILASCK